MSMCRCGKWFPPFGTRCEFKDCSLWVITKYAGFKLFRWSNLSHVSCVRLKIKSVPLSWFDILCCIGIFAYTGLNHDVFVLLNENVG